MRTLFDRHAPMLRCDGKCRVGECEVLDCDCGRVAPRPCVVHPAAGARIEPEWVRRARANRLPASVRTVSTL